MSKVVDLRREIKERLNKKNIINLSELRLRPIDINGDVKKVENSFNRAMYRIGEALIAETMSTDKTDEDKVKEIERLVNIHDIKVGIEITNVPQVKRLIKSNNNGKELKVTFVKLTIRLDDEIAETYSSLEYEPKKSQEGIFYFRDNPKEKIPFTSFRKAIGTIYFYNSLKKYIERNKEMAKLMLLKYINQQGEYIDLTHQEEIITELKDMGFTAINEVKIYLNEYSQKITEKIIKREMYAYFNWQTEKDYYNSLDVLFPKTTSGLYMVNKVMYLKLSSYFFNFMYELNKEEEHDVKEERRISSDYARSYETKKNIPLKVQEEMKKSKFLSHFGYVEYDELVDLEKVKVIEKEWQEVNKVINFPVAKNHSLRFRRLGKHKASGLYFYNQRAVCIDIKSPSSFIHEILHMIDYTTLPDTTLSSLFNFRPIIERYREITNEKIKKLDADDPYKTTWNGGSKFNKEYYQSAKEVFARCGEIYIKEILGIDNSLINISNPVIYPTDDELLMELIKNYYPTVIEVNNKNKDEIKEEVSASSESWVKDIQEILENNQISLFEMIDNQ